MFAPRLQGLPSQLDAVQVIKCHNISQHPAINIASSCRTADNAEPGQECIRSVNIPDNRGQRSGTLIFRLNSAGAEPRLPEEAGAEAGDPRPAADPSSQLTLGPSPLQSTDQSGPALGVYNGDNRYTSRLAFQYMDSHNKCNYFQSNWLNLAQV